MPSLSTLLFGLGSLAFYVHGASLSNPGKAVNAVLLNHRIPRTLQEPNYKRDSNFSPLVKKDSTSLFKRQAATCDPSTVACPSGGCCDTTCCGNGCCPAGFACQFVGTIPGCCPIGQTCQDTISGCSDAGYVHCTNYQFCCPAGKTCSLDGNGNSQCNDVGAGTNPPAVSDTPSSSSSIVSPASSSSISTPVAGTGNGNGNGNTSLNFGGVTTTPPTGAATHSANTAATTTKNGNVSNNGGSNTPNGARVQYSVGAGLTALTMLVGILVVQ